MSNQLANQRGVILASSLVILSALVLAGIGARVMLQNDHRTAANLRGSTEAFYLAQSGIEWSKSEISTTSSFPPAPADRSLGFTSGTFSVSFLSPTVISPLAAKVTVKSVGSVGVATHTLQSQLRQIYDLGDGALAIRGNAASVVLKGAGIRISGMDHEPASGTVLANALIRPAISAGNSSLQGLIETAVASLPPGSIDNGGLAPTLAASGYLSAAAIAQLANDLCAAPGALVGALPSGELLRQENQVWGNSTTPQLRCFDGLPTGGDGLAMAANNSGAGILVLRNADLVLEGSLHWEGLILVSGSNVSLRATGNDSKTIYGSVMINESAAPAAPILDIQGALQLRFSHAALARSASLVPSMTLNSLYSILPRRISQAYWRSLSL